MNLRRIQLVPILLVAAQVLAAWASSAHHHHHDGSCGHEHAAAEHSHGHCHADHAHHGCSHGHGDHRHEVPVDSSVPPADHDHEHCTLCKLLAQSWHVGEVDIDMATGDLVVAFVAEAAVSEATSVALSYRSRAPPAFA